MLLSPFTDEKTESQREAKRDTNCTVLSMALAHREVSNLSTAVWFLTYRGEHQGLEACASVPRVSRRGRSGSKASAGNENPRGPTKLRGAEVDTPTPLLSLPFPRAVILAPGVQKNPDTPEACWEHCPLGPPGLSWAGAGSTVQQAAVPATPSCCKGGSCSPETGGTHPGAHSNSGHVRTRAQVSWPHIPRSQPQGGKTLLLAEQQKLINDGSVISDHLRDSRCSHQIRV